MQDTLVEQKKSCAAAWSAGLAWCAFCFTSLFVPTPAGGSYTASFQPCDLPVAVADNNGVLARCHVEFAGKPGTVELIGMRPDRVRAAVFRNRDGHIVQRIAVSAHPFIDPENVSIILRDMNFDGMPDFGLRDFAVNGANEPWRFWLWDVLQRKFVYHEVLSRLPNPEVSSVSKVVRSYIVGARNVVTTNTYIWHNGKLLLRGSVREPSRK